VKKRNMPIINLPDLGSLPAAMVRASGPANPESLLNRVAAEYEDVTRIMSQLGDEVKKFHRDAREKDDEFSARIQTVEQMVAMASIQGFGSHGGAFDTVASRLMHQIGDSPLFSHLKEGNQGTCRVKIDAGIRAALTNDGKGTSNDGSIPSQPERVGIVGEVQRPLRLLDALPTRPTSSDSVEFVKLNSTGDASEQDHEGDEKAEIDADGTLVRAEIVTIAAHATASKQVLSDHAALQSNIDRLIRHKLLSRLEHQLINGAGGQGKIAGLLTQGTAFIPTIGATPADIIGEALVRQAEAGYLPSLIVMNPLDWFRIQITKSATEQEYMFGSPTVPVPPALWNAAVVRTPSMPEGRAMTIDTSFVTVLDRETLSVMVSNTHKDYFTRNLVSVLGELRAGLEVLDAAAIYEMDLVESSGS
jgi:HK97 family phage major capsid protein